MEKNRRKDQPLIPDKYQQLLTAQQLKALKDFKVLGVTLYAVRRPLFQEPTVIVKFVAKNKFGVLLADGRVDYLPELSMRRQLNVVNFPAQEHKPDDDSDLLNWISNQQ